MNKKTKINFYGPPCSGKTYMAHETFLKLKGAGVNVGFIGEFAQELIYKGYSVGEAFSDPIYILGEQMHREEMALKVRDVIVCESPLLLSSAYAEYNKVYYRSQILAIARSAEAKTNNIDFKLNIREPYQLDGRIHTKEQSEAFDKVLLDVLEWNITGTLIKTNNFNDIWSIIKRQLYIKE